MELILNTFGASLCTDNDAFLVRAREGEQRIPCTSIDSIQISRGAQITSDAIMLAIKNEIEVLFVERTGDPLGRVWSAKYGSVSTIRKGQLHFTFSHDAVQWIKGIIMKKIENQQALMMMMSVSEDGMRKMVSKAVNRLEDYRDKVQHIEGEVVADIAPKLRGWEGLASKVYFEALNVFLPPSLQIEERSQHPAKDPLNALLNYGYGILYGKIEGALIRAGVDPYIGIMHRDNYNRPVLVYDIIEIFRIWVDYVVYSIAIQDSVTEEFYSVKSDGSYWLEPLGRRILIQSLSDYLSEVVDVDGASRSREHHLFLYAQAIAQKFKSYN